MSAAETGSRVALGLICGAVEQQQLLKFSTVQREIGYERIRDSGASLGIFGIQKHIGCGHGHRLALIPYVQGQIYAGHVSNTQPDVSLLGNFETLLFRRNLVDPN